MKFAVLLVVKTIVSWPILCMDKYMCVVHLFYAHVHTWFDATHVFCFCTHGTHMCDACAIIQVVGDLYCM